VSQPEQQDENVCTCLPLGHLLPSATGSTSTDFFVGDPMSKVLARVYEHEGKSIEILFSETVYFNATVAGKGFLKRPAHWLELLETCNYIEALSARTTLDRSQLVRTLNGGSAPGTWFHQKLIVPYARWLSPDFAVWCDEVIFDLLKMNAQPSHTRTYDQRSLEPHMLRSTQIDLSKQVNAEMYNRGGRTKVISYNKLNCQVRTGKLPSEVISDGKEIGLKAKERSSAKEVLRHTHPEKACGMSFADSLVVSGGDEIKSLALSVRAEDIFKGMMELGITPCELLA